MNDCQKEKKIIAWWGDYEFPPSTLLTLMHKNFGIGLNAAKSTLNDT